MAEHASMPNVSVVRDFMEETTVRHVSHKVTIAFTAGCSQLFWQKLKRAKIVFKEKNRKDAVLKKRSGVPGNYFLSLGELYNFAFTKAFKSSTPQISETKHFRLPVILLREQVLYLTKAGKNSLFLSLRSTSVKYFFSYAAICKIPCQNGGTCSKPNQCTCPTGYGSKTCNKRK